MARFAVVVVGYNRVSGIERLSGMLDKAAYDEPVDLIFSIDNSGVETVVEFANKFEWHHGEKKVRTFEKRQGLKKHILQCGKFLEKYDAIAVLEDDVVVSRYYFKYMKAAYEQYGTDMNIAGVSLYAYGRNVLCGESFTPVYTGYDVYFMKFAQSWGQVWFKKQWKEFTAWLQEKDNQNLASNDFPEYVSSWAETSWLKYHIRYCFEKNKYFVYPYASFSSCFSDAGEHTHKQSNLLQVPLAEGWNSEFKFPSFENNLAVRYDTFFEREGLEKYLQTDGKICADIYGVKKEFNARYILSSQVLNYKCIKSFGLNIRPHENNAIYEIAGEMIYLYDTTKPEKSSSKISDKARRVARFKYYYNLYSNGKEQIETTLDKILEQVRSLFVR